MTGCFDMAEFFGEFDEDGTATIYELCESCANYWRNHKEETPKITAYLESAKAGQK